ncbi:MAG: ABC transporter permease [Verrucomicrobiae bacterium]|nr:ABC transporter permease [Verrucomicrobiae bacterium]
MAIPLKYNLRNLLVRWRTSVATLLGIALVVAVFVMVESLAAGLKHSFVTTGDERNLLMLRKGSTADSNSQIGRMQVDRIRYMAGIARQADGRPLLSAESVILVSLARASSQGEANVLVRGLEPAGLELRPQARLVEGRMFRGGLREVICSRQLGERFSCCQLGRSFRAGKNQFKVVGVFDAGRSAYDSEIWMDVNEARSVFDREFFSSILFRPENEEAAARLKKTIEDDRQLTSRIIREPDYFKEQTMTAGPIKWFGDFLSWIMSIGAVFAVMNTMYATIGRRIREVGTLRVLGFRRREILISFLLESLFLGLIGGVIGCLLALPLNGVATGTINLQTFSEVAFQFRVTPDLLIKGMVFSMFMGVAGGFLPARVAASTPVLQALKSV